MSSSRSPVTRFFKNLFRSDGVVEAQTDPASEHAVLVHLVADGSELSLDIIEDPLIEAINQAGVGEFDGNEFGPDDAVLYMYGPSADELFSIADPVLQSLRLPTGSFVVKRYGPPGAEEVRIGLG